MCLIPIVVYIIAALVVNAIISPMFVDPDVTATIAEAIEANDIGALFKAAAGGAMTKTGTIVSALASAALSYGVTFLFNNMLQGQAGDNQFGPQT